MLPSRGLRPAHFAPLASRQSLYACPSAARQFSSVPRNSTFSALSQRSSALRSANWRTGATASPSAPLNASAVRYGSWYAPWSWGNSSTPSPGATPTTATPAEFSPIHQTPAPKPAVTTATPELAPAGIDQPAVVDTVSSSASQPAARSVEELVDAITRSLPEPGNNPINDSNHAIDHIGALKEMGLDYGWGPTALYERIVEHMYLLTEMGWGTSILASVVAIRLVLFFTVNRWSSDNMAKMAAVTPLVRDIDVRMREAIKNGETAQSAVYKAEMTKIYKDVGVNPLMSLPPMFVQMAMGYGAWRCLRGMADLPVPGLSQGGFLWFQDLTLADPYYILPAAIAGLTYTVLRLGGETGTSNQTAMPGFQSAIQTGLPVIMFFFSMTWPSGVQIYMFFTTIFGAVQARLYKNPTVRSLLRMSPLPDKDSQEMWAKVARREISLDKVVGPDGKLRASTPGSNNPTYQAPSKPGSKYKAASQQKSRTTQYRGLTLKSGTHVPLHMQTADKSHNSNKELQYRDHDFDNMPDGYMAKVDWMGRNFQPRFLFNRFRLWLASLTNNPKIRARLLQTKKDREKEKREDYEARRRMR